MHWHARARTRVRARAHAHTQARTYTRTLSHPTARAHAQWTDLLASMIYLFILSLIFVLGSIYFLSQVVSPTAIFQT